MKTYSKSDVGLIRQNNQDYFITGNFFGGNVFAIVCDGMGGAKGGNIASHVAVELISNELKKIDIEKITTQEIKTLMFNLTKSANDKVFKISKDDPTLYGMGTTIVFAIVKDDLLHLINVGDSRAYIVSEDYIFQITRDHSMVQQLIESGKITKEQAQNHPKKNVITRALGVYAELDIDYFEHSIKDHDAVLICTDGLTNYLNDNELLSTLKNFDGEIAIDKFISQAKDRGGGDNITVVIIRR